MLLAEGRLDNENGDPKVLVDRLSEVFISTEQAGDQEIDPYLSYLPDEENDPSGERYNFTVNELSRPVRPATGRPPADPEWGDIPPPPPDPDDWHLDDHPGFTLEPAQKLAATAAPNPAPGGDPPAVKPVATVQSKPVENPAAVEAPAVECE